MKIKCFILVLILFTLKISSGEEISVYRYSFLENSGTYIFGDNVRVRKDPEIKNSNAIDKLNTGDKITIIKKTDQVMVIDGYKEYWYKIAYRKNNKDLEGYVWGGLFSICYSVKGDKLFLAGIKKYNDNGFTAECKLVEKGKVLSSVVFEPHYLPDGINEGVYEYTVSAWLEDGKALEGIGNVFRIFFNYEACGYPRGNVWIGYGKDQLYYIGKDTSVSEAGVFHVEEKFVFPSESKSAKNLVILVNDSYDFDERLNDYKLTEKKETKFTWANNKLNPVK
jgi:hypothetical protein